MQYYSCCSFFLLSWIKMEIWKDSCLLPNFSMLYLLLILATGHMTPAVIHTVCWNLVLRSALYYLLWNLPLCYGSGTGSGALGQSLLSTIQSTILFLFRIVHKNLKTGSVVKKSVAAAQPELMA